MMKKKLAISGKEISKIWVEHSGKITKKMVRKRKAQGYSIYTETTNSKRQLKRLIKLGVDLILIDDVEGIFQLLENIEL